MVARAHIGVILDRRTVLVVVKAILCAVISVVPVAIWRILSSGTLGETMLQVPMFLILLIGAYSMTRLLRFKWFGFNGLTRIPFHLALEN
jgi:hypothetical protein